MKVSTASTLLAIIVFAINTLPGPSLAEPVVPSPAFVDQGVNWTPAGRKDFYGRDQGSRIMPLRWMVALKLPDGRPFLADSFTRYGYLPNPQSVPAGLPVGFTVAASDGQGPIVGMTCAACHTRQIEVGGTAYRIDGGPAVVDFQGLLSDLDVAVNSLLTDPAAFANFANVVLGSSAPPARKSALRLAVSNWYKPFHTLMSRALPKEPWGLGRLDAVSMIFNRLSGLDIGPPPTYMIPDNIKPATAPVRYPFLWNATMQDKTQWPGFADNGNEILGLARNVGEVYGVFGVFRPKDRGLLGIDYLHENSVNFQGLNALEDLIRAIGPPKWPWQIDEALATNGKAIFEREAADGGCAGCHGIKPGATRFLNQSTWATPVQDVGTDSRAYRSLDWKVNTGVLKGAWTFSGLDRLGATDSPLRVLKTSVVGAIVQNTLTLPTLNEASPTKSFVLKSAPEPTDSLKGAFNEQPAAKVFAYESRVLQGIWAAAPYLHNGSVPTLAELLKPAAERVETFVVGPDYDIANVGLASTQTKFSYTMKTTDCSQRDSGNSRCGHEFGTQLTPTEKKALLEYLKVL